MPIYILYLFNHKYGGIYHDTVSLHLYDDTEWTNKNIIKVFVLQRIKKDKAVSHACPVIDGIVATTQYKGTWMAF